MDSGKIVDYAPPILSQFEDFSVKNGKILTRFHAEPVFFRAMVKHCRQAVELTTVANSRLHDIFEERLQAVINAAACLEALINVVGSEQVHQWERYKKLSPEGKWHLCLLAKGKSNIFNTACEPYQTLGTIISLRNYWLHYKQTFERTFIYSNTTITWLEAKMSNSFIEHLPERVRQIIRCSARLSIILSRGGYSQLPGGTYKKDGLPILIDLVIFRSIQAVSSREKSREPNTPEEE